MFIKETLENIIYAKWKHLSSFLGIQLEKLNSISITLFDKQT